MASRRAPRWAGEAGRPSGPSRVRKSSPSEETGGSWTSRTPEASRCGSARPPEMTSGSAPAAASARAMARVRTRWPEPMRWVTSRAMRGAVTGRRGESAGSGAGGRSRPRLCGAGREEAKSGSPHPALPRRRGRGRPAAAAARRRRGRRRLAGAGRRLAGDRGAHSLPRRRQAIVGRRRRRRPPPRSQGSGNGPSGRPRLQRAARDRGGPLATPAAAPARGGS